MRAAASSAPLRNHWMRSTKNHLSSPHGSRLFDVALASRSTPSRTFLTYGRRTERLSFGTSATRCATSSPTHTSRAVLPRANCSLRAPSTRNVRGWWILSALNAMCHPTWRHEAIEEYGLKRSLPFHPFKLLLEGRSSFQPGRAEPHLVTDASALEISDEAVQLFISCLRLRDCKADNRPSWHRFSKQLVSSRRSPCLRSSGKW
mmetsp:Transcript_25914/g.78802  ORF Transcript_25914/g.78802 Transcript_25914/m.78802 type:complete len:204 (+) Transcript_25914:213-824(+)